ncbi:preQ(1) synthase [Campylobacter concisus]|uniref:NADPH-dependent 7-cyano-7-deazaguanine reductase n=1 Tax=Campylobacter concisus TaxID=199 RepID=A0A0M5MFN8_9BACT|nr:preQ(1) synthase [Campylobacter concisus]ALF46737.1 7-cyano-7-deazaguanine reductase [Campylobacter concisus]
MSEELDMKYGEKILKEFDVESDLEVWENKQTRDYVIKITLPEFCCLCPRSGYPDFATIYLEYIPNKLVVELKAIKLYINSFMNRNISHEDSINEIYSVLEKKLEPKFMKIVGDFNPRGNVHTVIEISSDLVVKKPVEEKEFTPRTRERSSFGDKPRERRSTSDRGSSRAGGSRGGRDDKFQKDDKPRRSLNKEGFRKISYADDKKPKVVKKDK